MPKLTLQPSYRKPTQWVVLSFTVLALVCGIFMATINPWQPLRSGVLMALVVMCLMVVGWFIIALPVFIHEMGHVLGAKMSGLTVTWVNVLGLDWTDADTQVRPRTDASGFVVVKSTPDLDTASNWMRYVVGGPVACFVVGLLIMGVSKASHYEAWLPLGVWIAIHGYTLVVPGQVDFEYARSLRKDPRSFMGQQAAGRIHEALKTSPVIWNPEDVARLEWITEESFRHAVAVYRSYYAISTGVQAVPLSLAHLEVARNTSAFRSAQMDAAFAIAFYGSDPEYAQRCLDEIPYFEREEWTIAARTYAAICLARGDLAAASEACVAARRHQVENDLYYWHLGKTWLDMVEAKLAAES